MQTNYLFCISGLSFPVCEFNKNTEGLEGIYIINLYHSDYGAYCTLRTPRENFASVCIATFILAIGHTLAASYDLQVCLMYRVRREQENKKQGTEKNVSAKKSI